MVAAPPGAIVALSLMSVRCTSLEPSGAFGSAAGASGSALEIEAAVKIAPKSAANRPHHTRLTEMF